MILITILISVCKPTHNWGGPTLYYLVKLPKYQADTHLSPADRSAWFQENRSPPSEEQVKQFGTMGVEPWVFDLSTIIQWLMGGIRQHTNSVNPA